MASKKDEEKPKKKKNSDDGLFFLGIIGVVVLIFLFYISPNKQATVLRNQNSANTVATSSVTRTKFFDLFRVRPTTSVSTTTPPRRTSLFGIQRNTSTQTNIRRPSSTRNNRQEAPPQDMTVYSPWKGKVSLQRGNATSEKAPHKEYVTIRAKNVGDEGVRITGWSLQNGRGNKFFNQGGNNVTYPSETEVIPDGAKIFLPGRINYFQPVTLYNNQSAIVISGSALNVGSKISGFQVNKCAGYIEQNSDYKFFPSLKTQCPIPRKEVGVNMLEKSCYDFVKSLSSCRTPKFPEFVYVRGKAERGYVDNTPGLSSQCKDFLKSRYNYNACVVIHSSDADFYGNEWRLFLNRTFEMWGNDRESFTLFDAEGKVVDQISTAN